MTTLIVDGNNILARSDFAAKGSKAQMSVNGVNTSALLIFINLISKYVRQVKPERMIICWDSGHGLRDKIYPEYKASRRKSNHDAPGVMDLPDGTRIVQGVEVDDTPRTPRSQAMQFCTFAAIPHKGRPNWEADDLIAIYCAITPGPKVVLSGDKDLLQLLSNETMQIRPGDAKGEHWDLSRFQQEFECHPEQLPMLMALTGDASDGIPGVRGLGPKKAMKVLAEAEWDWDALMTLLGPEKAQEAAVARQLVDLVDPDWASFLTDPTFHPGDFQPVPYFIPSQQGSPLWLNLLDFLAEWQMNSVSQRLHAGHLWEDDASEPTVGTAQEAFADFDFK